MLPNLDETKQFEVLKVNRYEVEQNAIFLDYNTETLLTQIQNFAETKFHVRLSLAKNLKTIEEVMKNGQENSFAQLLQKLSKDHEEMQIQLLQYFKSKRNFKIDTEHYKQLTLAPLKNLANGPYLEIKEESCILIGQLAHSLQKDDLQDIIQFANTLAKSDNQQNKIVAIQLFVRLARDLPPGKRESIFENQFISIYSGSSVRVKKEIILELGRLAESMTSEFVDNKIIKGFYLKETKENAWGIRKACVEVITELLVKSKLTKEDLGNTLLTFLKDGNKFVRIASHKIIPEFIAKYGDKNVPKALFDAYIVLIDLDINNQVSKPNQIIQKIAFYFPGVLQTVGATKWPQMNSLFNRLLHNRNQDVKRPLADSLHEISQIIGPKNSKQYLFSSLDYILRQQMDSIKLCAIRNLAKFVGQFETQTKQNLIDVFLVLQKDPKKWRVRFLISNQLKYLSQIYDAETNFKYLFPISLKLCNDQVSEVRKAASEQIVHVVNQLKKQQPLYKMAIESLIGYAASEKFLQRQTFCFMLKHLLDHSEQFFKDHSQIIEKICQDPVALVRISMAISINQILGAQPSSSSKLEPFIAKLCKDPQVAEYFEQFKQAQVQGKQVGQ